MSRITLTLIFLVLFFNTSDAVTLEECNKLSRDYAKLEAAWSDLYTDEAFLESEQQRLGQIIWDTETTRNVIRNAIAIQNKKNTLTPRERLTLNTRIPSKHGHITEDGTFSVMGKNTIPLPLVIKYLDNITSWSHTNRNSIDSQIKESQNKLNALQQQMITLKVDLERWCAPYSTARNDTALEDSIAERFTQRENNRQKEVSNRTWNDIERQWIYRYYPGCTTQPCTPTSKPYR
jgi:hypothetical protein